MKKKIAMLVVTMAMFLVIPILASAEKNVVIDPGHGGWDSGTTGYSGSSTGFYEKHANLAISEKLRDKLKAAGFNVYMTHNDGTKYLSLQERTDLANAFAKGKNDQTVFVSVHHNAAPTNLYVRGFESYHYDNKYAWEAEYPPDPIQVAYGSESKRLAETIHPSTVNAIGLTDKGMRNDQAFYVIRNTQMPSLLLEMGYMSNPTEEALIKTWTFQNNAAEGIKNGIVSYFKVFEVYNAENKRLKVYKTKEEAIQYSKSQSNTYVFDKYQQKKVYENLNEYSVYQKGNDKLKTYPIKEDAIQYAGTLTNTRVVDEHTEKILWSNYLPKKYSVQTEAGKSLWSYYDVKSAIDYAKWKATPLKVVDIDSKGVIWSSIDGVKINRYINDTNLIGLDRMETAIKVSKDLYPSGFSSSKAKKAVVLATAYDFADALSVGPLAAQLDNAPILLTSKDQLPSEVENELARLNAKEVYVIGGKGAVSTAVQDRLAKLGLTVTRVGGADRYATNLLINKKLTNVKGVFVASGKNYADALGAAPIASANQWAIVLTGKDSINSSALSYVKGKQVKVLGGGSAISSTVEQSIKRYSTNVERLSGADRYKTLAKVLTEFKSVMGSDKFIVSTGTNYPDALTASALSVKTKAPIVLVGGTLDGHLEDFILEYQPAGGVKEVIKVGGKVDDAIIAKMKNVLY
ncbi:cell wall-binding repeat-containing protein [Rossellomorea sp. GCM10028870]|uniref:cell wall-binding repeat-containing protein n=1 Tax=Rossellomorea sp. GCM10028870 TaxID=3273426 RepID=UPI003616667B